MIKNQSIVHHLLVIDESGAMRLIAREVIYQVNQAIHAIRTEAIRNEHQEHKITLIVTSSVAIRCIYSNAAALVSPLLHLEHYVPTGYCNIYDALGVGIATLRVAENRSDACMRNQVTIFTNSKACGSKKYGVASLRSLIRMLKGQGWIFSFVCLSDVYLHIAKELGIDLCCVVKTRNKQQHKEVVINMMKRQWILRHQSIDKIGEESVTDRIEAA